MALVVVRASVGTGKFFWGSNSVCVSKIVPTCRARAICRVDTRPLFLIQSCNISGKALRDTSVVKPAPYPYKTKNYGLINAWFDVTTKRLDENSKIIVVEGPIGAGKSQFAQSLAEDLDMFYMPEASVDMMYINDYNFDLRQLDPLLPEDLRSYDVKSFCQDPNHRNAANFQICTYKTRYSQYIDALAHVLSTGQGVVLDRCAYSDFVFLEAMHKMGYVSKGARSVYYEIRNNTITELMRPHLVIYLDIPVPLVKERIKKRNIPYEVNSKAFSTEYLTALEQNYKEKYLKEISTHAELLVYDWSDFGDVEVVIEDIERIDFDRFDKHDPKMIDWRLPKEWNWREARWQYTCDRSELMDFFNVPRFDVPELVADANDAMIHDNVIRDAPGMKFRTGFNKDMGDTGILVKN